MAQFSLEFFGYAPDGWVKTWDGLKKWPWTSGGFQFKIRFPQKTLVLSGPIDTTLSWSCRHLRALYWILFIYCMAQRDREDCHLVPWTTNGDVFTEQILGVPLFEAEGRHSWWNISRKHLVCTLQGRPIVLTHLWHGNHQFLIPWSLRCPFVLEFHEKKTVYLGIAVWPSVGRNKSKRVHHQG